MLACPFCGSPETDRFELDGRTFLVFGCMFTPEVDPKLSEEDLRERLATAYPSDGSGAYFRKICDRLHVYVTKGEGARQLTGATTPAPHDR